MRDGGQTVAVNVLPLFLNSAMGYLQSLDTSGVFVVVSSPAQTHEVSRAADGSCSLQTASGGKFSMPRVSMIVWNNFRNDARVLKEAETLQAAGHEVTVFALHTPGETQRRETLGSGVRVVRVMRSPLWTLRQRLGMTAKPENPTAPRGSVAAPAKLAARSKLRLAAGIVTRGTTHSALLAAVIASRPDVVHAHDFNTLPTAWLASLISRSALVYDAHEISTDREGYARERKFIGWIEKRLMPRADATITTTEARAQFFARAYKVPRPIVLQNRPRRQEWAHSTRIRDELGLSEDWPIIIYQGGVQPGRGLERLATAAASVPRAYVVYVGSGKSEPAVRQVVADLKLEERVKLIPKVDLDQLSDYTRSADIGVQPIENTCLNHYTTDSNKLFEYVMAGLPVVASDFRRFARSSRPTNSACWCRPTTPRLWRPPCGGW